MKTSQKVYLIFKRLIGIVGSLLGIIFCLALFWWWIIPINLVVTKGHPFFVHKRLGKHKKVFGCIKFRSMKLDANPNLAPSNMDNQTQLKMETSFGAFLRKTSLDETPQLLNIFIGQMAFIGPRPGAAENEDYLVECREKYNPSAYEVKPGLGGLAQLKLKRDHNPENKAELDHEYVANISFWNDVKLFVGTITNLFVKKD